MKYSFLELIDLKLISELLSHFHKATGVRCDVFDLDGRPLTTSIWESLCINFHRKHPVTMRRCIESDTKLVNRLLDQKKYVIYRCKNGLIDAATSVVVKGVHIANILVGQVFCELPDLDWFRNQAMEFGFDEDSYLEAVLRVPVISRDRLELVLQYLSYLAELLGEFGLRHLKQLEAENALRVSESNYRNIFENAVEGIFQADPHKQYLSVNPALAQMHGYSSSEEMLNNIPSMEDHLFSRPEDRSRFFDLLDRYGLVKAFETQSKTKEGKKIWVSVSARLLRNNNPFVLYEGTVENITERKEAEYKMLAAQSRLETLSKGLLKKMEIERHHIANELHDEIGQTLTFLKMELESIRLKLEQTELGDELEESIKIVDKTFEQIRRISANLRPAILDDLGLVAALRWLVNSMAKTSNIDTHFYSDEDIGPELTKGIATACFRVAQEAITNVIRHAMASTLTVSLNREKRQLVLTVIDNGKGFDVKDMQQRLTTDGKLGLLGIQERVTLSGGSLSIDSASGCGTKLVARFPYREKRSP